MRPAVTGGPLGIGITPLVTMRDRLSASRRIGLTTLAVTALAVGVLFLFFKSAEQPQPTPSEVFLDSHWAQPIEPQGASPDSTAALVASLAPRDCGSCHPRQFDDWQSSNHARSMGKGLLWQLPLLGQDAGNRCLGCHAPLAEQKALQAQRIGWSHAPEFPPPGYVAEDLDQQGLVCAACHLRGHQVFGPPARSRTTPVPSVHVELTRHKAFEESEFCAPCHQFPDDGPQVNGKLQENTYQQWLNSPAAKKGEQCQNCHMPDRRHLWRGIHDPEMVRRAMTLNLELTPTEDGNRVLQATLANVGAGHHLPTYMVPKLLLNVELLQAADQPIQLAKKVIGWYVETDLRTERFDTRIPAGEQLTLSIPLRKITLPENGRLRVSLDVHPREHYERMFRDVVGNKNVSQETKLQVREVLDDAISAHYRLITQYIDLNQSRLYAK